MIIDHGIFLLAAHDFAVNFQISYRGNQLFTCK
jgi:hypothetical protein